MHFSRVLFKEMRNQVRSSLLKGLKFQLSKIRKELPDQRMSILCNFPTYHKKETVNVNFISFLDILV